EHPIANLDARAPDDVRHRPTIDAELDSERARRLLRLVPLHDLGSLQFGQTRLFLTERWDGSIGRSITPLTTENAPQTRHDVGVGVTTHELHFFDTLKVVTRTPVRGQPFARRMTRASERQFEDAHCATFGRAFWGTGHRQSV